MATVRPGVMKKAEREAGRKGTIVRVAPALDAARLRTKVLETVKSLLGI